MARFGGIKMDAIGERHRQKRSDGAAEAKRQRSDLADRAFRVHYCARVFVQNVGDVSGVDVGLRRIGVVSAKDIENRLGSF